MPKHRFKRTRTLETERRESPAALAHEVGPVVYYIRTDDGLIKIGFTSDLSNRKSYFGRGWHRVLAVTPGTLADESAQHERWAAYRAKGEEFYHPAPELMAHINDLRQKLGVSQMEA
jgi:hypothetical protein